MSVCTFSVTSLCFSVCPALFQLSVTIVHACQARITNSGVYGRTKTSRISCSSSSNNNSSHSYRMLRSPPMLGCWEGVVVVMPAVLQMMVVVLVAATAPLPTTITCKNIIENTTVEATVTPKTITIIFPVAIGWIARGLPIVV